MENSKIRLSVIVPSIRIQNLDNLFWSIYEGVTFNFELIVVSPFGRPNNIVHSEWIKSYRSPNACQQQGLMIAKGEYITFAADDGEFMPGALNYALEMAEYKTIIVGKYLEGDNPNPDMLKDDYYRFKYHQAYRLPGVPPEGLIFNCGIISRQLLIDLGGHDAENFECTTCSHADVGIRASKVGAEMILMDDPMFKCSHQPGKSGDHAPIDRAMQRDLKNFAKIYEKPNDRIKIDLMNFEKTPERWAERFK